MAYLCAELVNNVCTTYVLYEPWYEVLAITPRQAGEISMAIISSLIIGWVFGEMANFIKSMAK